MNRQRGQINFDFTVGVSIVIIAVIIAFSLVPGIFGGVTEARQQSDQVVADRIAANLVEGLLPGSPNSGTLETGCVVALYSSLDACGLSEDSLKANLQAQELPAESPTFVNVSVLRNGAAQYWDEANYEFRGSNCPSPTDCTALFGGNNPGGAEQVASTRRAVSIDGYRATIVVRVW